MEEVMEWVQSLENLWLQGELTAFAFKITNLCNSLDDNFVATVMDALKNRIYR